NMTHLRKYLPQGVSILLFLVLLNSVTAQTATTNQRQPREFVLLSGVPGSQGTTLIGSSITINGGSVGAHKLIQTTGNATINSNIFSADKIIITNSNLIKGDISAGA